MGDDILADWKTERFIIADQTQHGYDDIIIVLCDIKYWNDHYNQLAEWCLLYGGRVSGMTVELDTHEQLSLFCLRWR